MPTELGALYRICRAFDRSERNAVDSVLAEFFLLSDDGYHNVRADIEIVKRAQHHKRLSKGAQRTNEKRWAGRSANRPASRSALASPQPQPQPQPKAEKSSAAKSAPPADVRYGPFLEFAKASFEAKHAQPPTWDCFGKDGAALTAFLRRAPHVTQNVWQSHVLNYLDSNEPFTVKQGGSLSYFVSRFDAFASGPILAPSQKGGFNGKSKLTGDDLTNANLRAAGFIQ